MQPCDHTFAIHNPSAKDTRPSTHKTYQKYGTRGAGAGRGGVGRGGAGLLNKEIWCINFAKETVDVASHVCACVCI